MYYSIQSPTVRVITLITRIDNVACYLSECGMSKENAVNEMLIDMEDEIPNKPHWKEVAKDIFNDAWEDIVARDAC